MRRRAISRRTARDVKLFLKRVTYLFSALKRARIIVGLITRHLYFPIAALVKRRLYFPAHIRAPFALLFSAAADQPDKNKQAGVASVDYKRD